ncbi:MAG: inositol monophosphatase family protein [Thermoanaerobaculia bacterium]|nr:inositol monophosphatase family protein [Thermoanaerobaculia bacterium]
MRLEDIVSDWPAEDARRVREAVGLVERQVVGAAALQGEVETLRKADDSPVTVVDLLHQSQVQQLLSARFPGDGLVCEEPRSLQEEVFDVAAELSLREYGVELGEGIPDLPERGERTWVLDPIDGTKGFVSGRYFAIALGYFVGAEACFGAIAVPGRGEGGGMAIDRTVAIARAGSGAWIRRVDDDPPGWSRLQPQVPTGPVRVAVSLAHGGPLAERVRSAGEVEVVALDSQAKYLAVATGEIDAYLRAARDDGRPDVVWDHMPAGVVAREAGCRLRHFSGSEVRFRPEPTVRFEGGVACYRERPGGGVGTCLDRLLDVAVFG